MIINIVIGIIYVYEALVTFLKNLIAIHDEQY